MAVTGPALHAEAVMAGNCHCLCGKAHPGRMGVCDNTPVTRIRRWSALTGPRDVPTCAPCEAAELSCCAEVNAGLRARLAELGQEQQ